MAMTGVTVSPCEGVYPTNGGVQRCSAGGKYTVVHCQLIVQKSRRDGPVDVDRQRIIRIHRDIAVDRYRGDASSGASVTEFPEVLTLSV